MARAILDIPSMPQNCYECPMRRMYRRKWFCQIIMHIAFKDQRRPDCPLKLVEDKDEQTNVKCRHCNSESVEIIARGTESILYKCKVCKMEFAKLNIKEG